MDTTLENTQQKPSWAARLAGIGALLLVLCFGWYLRYQASMTTELIPGINGAYYPLQVRSILQGDGLGIPDFPLLFYFDAGLALVLGWFIEPNQAIVLATRLVDLIVPVLLAVPVMLFAFEFSKGHSGKFRAAAATFLVGLVAVGNTSLLRMAGDFQKNAVALPLSLMFLFFLYRSFNTHQWRDYLLSGLFFILTCLTHLGVTALTLTVAGFYAIIALASHPNRKRAALIAGSLLLVAVLTLTAVYLLDPTRIERLLGVVLDPDSLFLSLDDGTQVSRTSGGINFFEERLLLGNLLGAIGVAAAVIFRKQTDLPTRTLLWATSLTALLFASPLISSSWSQRLALMAFIPGLVPLVFLAVRQQWGWVAAAGMAAIVLAATLGAPAVFNKMTLSTPAYLELEEMKNYLDDGNTLVYAEHGLEWWAAWAMDTDITNRFYLAAEAWEEYDAVYVLTQTNAAAFSSGEPRPATPQGSRPDPNPTATPPENPGQPQTAASVLLYEGDYFTLTKLESQPELRRGAGEPALEGQIQAVEAGQLVVEGEIILVTADTTLSSGPQEISLDQLESGQHVLIWGEWQGFFNRQLEASYITAVQPGRPNLNQQGGAPQPQDSATRPPTQNESPAMDTVQLGRLSMVTRAGWGAREMNLEARAETGWFNPQTNPTGVLRYPQPVADWLTTIVVHHSALQVERGPVEIQALHLDKSGYADIGYHFLIGFDGTLFEGRPIQLRGAHTEGFNSGTVGVVLLGNFENTDPSPQQLETLRQLILFLRNRYGITHLAGHRDFNPELTVCPGGNLEDLLSQIAQQTELIFGIEGYQLPPWDAP